MDRPEKHPRTGQSSGGPSAPRGAIRRASVDDAGEIGRLLHDFNNEFSEPVPVASVVAERIAGHLASGEAAILLAGDGPDGLAVLRFRPSLYGEGLDAYLEELYVAPGRRGQGLGRALLDRTIEMARGEGATRIEVGTGETDTVARALYESAGFSNRGSDPGGPVNYFYERDLQSGG
jgi:GNAT superfamily N-acetyltransferase